MKIVYAGLVRNTVDKPKEDIEMPPGSRVRDLLRLLAEKNGNAFRAVVLKDDGSLRPLATVLIDDNEIDELQGLDTDLSGKAEACIMVMVELPSGG